MVIARSTRELFDFITPADRLLGQELRTTFHLRRLPTRTMLRMHDIAHEHGKLVEVAVRAGVAGWDNLRDRDGTLVTPEFESKPAIVNGVEIERPMTLRSFEMLDMTTAAEIAGAVVSGNSVTTDDVKN